jgi:hypothetical protein
MRYARALITGVPALAQLVARETSTAIDLVNGTSLEVRTALGASIRGLTVPAALCDELGHWGNK